MVTIIADTTCNLPREEARKLGIPFLPQIIIFGEESYRDDTEIDTQTFLKKLKASSTLPKTAAPPPALYTPIYKELIEKGDTIIVITPSAELSGTMRSAMVAAQDFPGADIRVIDTRTIAGGLTSIVLCAVKWAKEGLDANEIEKRVRDLIKRQRIYFLVDTLEYLFKGGRIGGAQALFGSILQVKPILTLRDGKTESVETQRTKHKALARFNEIILSECPKGTDAMLAVNHADAEKEANELASFFAKALGIKVEDIPIYELPPAIVVHAGPGVIAVNFFVA
jgi:DegV family protein with EDD domain